MLDEGGLASPNVSSNDDEALALRQAVAQIRHCPFVTRVAEEEARIRAELKRLAGQTVETFVHRLKKTAAERDADTVLGEIIGRITAKRLKILRNVDDLLLEEIKNAGYYKKLWQSFAVLLPLKSVGVMGDQRTYENIVAIRAVTSKDAMTADWARLPHKLLGKISNRIINEVRGVNRVTYDISSKPPATIEWE